MLKRIRIKNYLSCQDVIIDKLGDLTALVGKNAAGKSNILKTIRNVANAAARFDHAHFDLYSSVNFSVELTFGDEQRLFDYYFSFDNNSGTSSERLTVNMVTPEPTSTVLFSKQGEQLHYNDKILQTNTLSPGLPTLLALLPEHEICQDLLTAERFLSSIRYYTLESAQGKLGSSFIERPQYEKWLGAQQEKPVPTDNNVLMQLLHMYHDKKEDFAELKALLGDHGLDIIKDIAIDTVSVKGRTAIYLVLFTVYRQGEETQQCQYDNLSYGTKRVLSLLLCIIYDKSSVLLIEQPEDGIHRGLLNKLIGICKQYAHFNQMIMATHSPLVMDNMAAQDIRLVTMQNGKTHCAGLSEQDLENAKSFLEDEGTLSDFIEFKEDSDG